MSDVWAFSPPFWSFDRSLPLSPKKSLSKASNIQKDVLGDLSDNTTLTSKQKSSEKPVTPSISLYEAKIKEEANKKLEEELIES